MTSPRSTQNPDQLTLLSVDSPARTSAKQARAPGWLVSDRACSTNCSESFAWWDLAMSSWRTSQRSLVEGWTRFSDRWPRQGMTRNGLAYRRRLWAPATSVIGGGALPTPVAQTGQGGPKGLDGGSAARRMLSDAGFPRSAGSPTPLPTPKAADGERGRDKARARPDTKGRELATVLRDQLLTPRTCSAMAARLDSAGNSDPARFPNLETVIAAQLLPTPTTNDSKNSTLPPSQAERDGLAGAMLRDDSIPTGEPMYLNPFFVEEMMGFPIGWTA
jgi:hypothetical protein